MTYKNLPTDHNGYFDYSTLPETVKAYWAGLLDGEGCLRFDTCSGKRLPYIALKMTCEETVKEFAELFDVVWSLRNRRGMKDHWKDCYSAKMTTHKAAKLCEALLPYFKTKKEIAKELSQYYIHQCEYCNADFWCFNEHKSCSKECTHKRKIQYDKEYRAKKKSLV